MFKSDVLATNDNPRGTICHLMHAWFGMGSEALQDFPYYSGHRGLIMRSLFLQQRIEPTLPTHHFKIYSLTIEEKPL